MASNPAPRVGSEFPLLACFFEFWEEVENLRRRVQSPGGGEDTFLPAAAGGREHLADVLRGQRAALAHPQAAITPPQLDETQYVMAATVDELFIGMNWDGAEGWTMRPLEVELFGTRRAGDEIFARIDRLTSGFAPVDTEMATVYLTALELGFKGRHADDPATLDACEARLRKLVGRRPPAMGPLVPACYDHTTVAGSGLRLPRSRLWWSTAAVIAALSVLVLVVTFVRFRGSTVEDARQRLETTFGRLAVWQ
jgi:type VI secretion system protein ImpK